MTSNSPEGKKPGRSRYAKSDNIKRDRKEIVRAGVYLIHFSRYRVQWRALMNTVISISCTH
jgi:hypothetical protein